jgi:hypothetical protein
MIAWYSHYLAALQLGDKHRITTPVNWNKGEDVIVHPGVTNEEAKTLFPEFTIHKVSVSESICMIYTHSFQPYLRTTPLKVN